MDIKVAQKVAEAVEALLKKYPELAKTTCERCRQSIYKEIKEELSPIIGNLIATVKNGDYSNGNISPEGFDEGTIRIYDYMNFIEVRVAGYWKSKGVE
jgi:hypothetical protein